MFLCVELGDAPGQDFMGPYQNTTPLLYDCRFAITKRPPPPSLTVMGAYGNATPLLKPIFQTADWPNCHGCIRSCYTSFTKGNFFRLQIWLDQKYPPVKILWVQTVTLHLYKRQFFFDYRFDLTKNTPPSQNFMGANCNATHPLLRQFFFDYRFDLTKNTPPPKFHRCNLSCYTCVKWYLRSMQI